MLKDFFEGKLFIRIDTDEVEVLEQLNELLGPVTWNSGESLFPFIQSISRTFKCYIHYDHGHVWWSDIVIPKCKSINMTELVKKYGKQYKNTNVMDVFEGKYDA